MCAREAFWKVNCWLCWLFDCTSGGYLSYWCAYQTVQVKWDNCIYSFGVRQGSVFDPILLDFYM